MEPVFKKKKHQLHELINTCTDRTFLDRQNTMCRYSDCDCVPKEDCLNIWSYMFQQSPHDIDWWVVGFPTFQMNSDSTCSPAGVKHTCCEKRVCEADQRMTPWSVFFFLYFLRAIFFARTFCNWMWFRLLIHLITFFVAWPCWSLLKREHDCNKV